MRDQTYPEIQFPNVTELDLKLASYYFPILVDVARERGKTISYGDLLKEARRLHPEYFYDEEGKQRETDFSTGRRLGTIWRFAAKKDYPIISTLVVNAATGECGHGVTDNLDPIAEREKVYAFDWDSVADDFLAHLSYEKEINRKRKIKKLKRRSSQEAAQALGLYWKETQDQWPNELRAHRDELQAEIEKGFDPATVFSDWVLKHLPKKKTPDYVYLAEYRNALNGEHIEGLSQIKIGCTSDLGGRALALSGGVKAPVEVILTHAWKVNTGKAFAVEQRLHGHFREHQVIGEWFDSLDGALAELVQEQLSTDYLTSEITEAVALHESLSEDG